jgi:acetylornithine deacetylase/succinyl-diaminopimelate desuccinylase-like protein
VATLIEELKRFVRFASVSAQSAHAKDVRACAGWLADHLKGIGMAGVRVIATPRHPIVYAEWKGAPGRPTVLIYGHYDVQPPDPLKEWTTPPFEPMVRGPYLYGRGACDDKGQLFAHVKALERFLKTAGRLPVNVKCLFEGEEEIGSPSLKTFLERHARDLKADAAVMSDTRMLGPDRPALTYSLRGGLSLEIEVTGPRQDLHSGTFGGAPFRLSARSRPLRRSPQAPLRQRRPVAPPWAGAAEDPASAAAGGSGGVDLGGEC